MQPKLLQILFADDLQMGTDLEIVTPATGNEPGRAILKQARIGEPHPGAPNSKPVYSINGPKFGFLANWDLVESPYNDMYWLMIPLHFANKAFTISEQTRSEPPFPGAPIVVEPCPTCGGQLVVYFEPNASLGINLDCVAGAQQNDHHHLYVDYQELNNFEQVVADRIISGQEVDFDRYGYGHTDEEEWNYLTTPTGTYRVWRDHNYLAHFEPVPNGIESHVETARERRQAWLEQKQVKFDAWREQTLNRLARSSAYPLVYVEAADKPDWVQRIAHWPKELEGAWYTTGNTYYQIDHPEEGSFILCVYGNATVAYASEEQTRRWRLQWWQNAITIRGEARAAWYILHRFEHYREHYLSDIDATIVAELGIETLARMARREIHRCREHTNLPEKDVATGEKYGIEVRVMERVSDEFAPYDRQDLPGVEDLWRDPVDESLWGHTYTGNWIEAEPLAEQVRDIHRQLTTIAKKGHHTPDSILEALNLLVKWPDGTSSQCREVLQPLREDFEVDLQGGNEIEVEESGLIGRVTFQDKSILEVWRLTSAVREAHPLGFAILRDPDPGTTWVLIAKSEPALELAVGRMR